MMRRALQWLRRKWRRPSTRRYAGAEHSDLLADWITGSSAPNDELRGDIRVLRNRARDLSKNETTTRQYLRLLRNNVIGPAGIKMQARCRTSGGNLKKSLNSQIEAAWLEWTKRPTIDGRGSLIAVQALLLRSVAVDGEAFAILHEGFDNPHAIALELLDASLIDHEMNRPARNGENAIDLGIERDTYGRRVRYWCKPAPAARERRSIDAKRVIHLYIPEHIDQVRGASWLNAAVKPLRHLDGYTEAELVAARASAAKLALAKANDLFDPNTKLQDTKMRFRAGTVQLLPPGYELDNWSPDHPNAAFPNFTKSVLRQIACGLGVSYNALANDLEGVNYSSMRSGLLIERDEWRGLQTWWIEEFLQPVYEAWLRSALFVGAVTGVAGQAPTPEMYAVKWRPRGWAWVDPLKDTNAGILAVNNALSSREEIIAETGGDFEETIEQLQEEQKLLNEYGITLPTGNPSVTPSDETATSASADEDANRYASSTSWSLQ
jgi:lambda family phage portal protein